MSRTGYSPLSRYTTLPDADGDGDVSVPSLPRRARVFGVAESERGPRYRTELEQGDADMVLDRPSR
jgi:hypothetical protein